MNFELFGRSVKVGEKLFVLKISVAFNEHITSYDSLNNNLIQLYNVFIKNHLKSYSVDCRVAIRFSSNGWDTDVIIPTVAIKYINSTKIIQNNTNVNLDRNNLVYIDVSIYKDEIEALCSHFKSLEIN